MTKRRPPTAGTFAWLAAVSAVACVGLPEIVDLTYVMGRQPSRDRVAVSNPPGPRVMGSLHTSADAEIAIDRFRFAAGTPFADEDVEQPAALGRRLEPAEHALDLPPDRIAPAPQANGGDLNASRNVVPSERAAATPDEAGTVRPDAEAATYERREPQEASAVDGKHAPAAAIAAAGAADDAKPASEAATVPPPAPSAAVETSAVSPVVPAVGGQGAAAVQPPGTDKPVVRKPAAEPQPTKRQAEPKQVTKRATAGLQSGKRQSAAADDGEAPTPKAKWRPENINNWPD